MYEFGESSPTRKRKGYDVSSGGGGSEISHCGGKSSAVRRIEQIARNREERRFQQTILREERALQAQKNGVQPHFEYAQMIESARAAIRCELNAADPAKTNCADNIMVCVRKRPLTTKELVSGEIDVVTATAGQRQLIVHEPKLKFDLTKYLDNHRFQFDHVFDEASTNTTVYRCAAQPLVDTIFRGGLATCFAYGQTGAGKTHTMGGEFRTFNAPGKCYQQNFPTGIYGLAAADILQRIGTSDPVEKSLSVSFFEIYGRGVFDLLSERKRLRILEDGKHTVNILELTEKPCTHLDEVLDAVRQGSFIRAAGQTASNDFSSRSHAVFQLVLRQNDGTLCGKLSLVDLAGNERGSDTNNCSQSDRRMRLEGADINRSLLALKECIRTLARGGGGHCPYRESVLTKVLRDSFTAREIQRAACMIALVSPNNSATDHTLDTLRYADRVKELVPNTNEADNVSRTASRGSDIDMSVTLERNVICDNVNHMISYWSECIRQSRQLLVIAQRTENDDYTMKIDICRNWLTLLKQMDHAQRDAIEKTIELHNVLIENY